MESTPVKRFNTAGPCVPSEHYMLPVLPRLPQVDDLIADKLYFVLHAPRQSGKTTFLDALTDKINSEGKMYALYVSLVSLQDLNDMTTCLNALVDQLNSAMRSSRVTSVKQKAYAYNLMPGILSAPTTMVKIFLNQLCEDLDKDLVVFFDEADCLPEAPLIPFLAQIRDGHNSRHQKGNKFPRSIALVGMRDIRDYLTQVRPNEQSKGLLASPFNIVTEKLTLANFTEKEIGDLFRQHTLASGQVFEYAAVASAWSWSFGQPWLVNALDREVVTKLLNKNYSKTITKDHIDEAAEILIQRRDTHIDSLLKRLTEPRVIKVMDAVFSGSLASTDNPDDRRYCLDLGLVTEQENG
ncbi:MAG: ATP-binding protein, partial [Deltaproteobacteria bacterium]|nr:ATP-binding protein [Deltaproteobacteria bacterium]